MIIDFHTHVFPPRLRESRSQYAARDPSFARLYADSHSRLATAEELIESMDREGVAISVIANYGWQTHELCVETNNYILEAVNHYPERLIGFCAVLPQTGDAPLLEIERCALAGAKGIGELRFDLSCFDLAGGKSGTTFIDKLREHRLMLMLHASEPVGHVYPGKGAVTPQILFPFIAAHPGLTFICAHWGGGLPFYALMPEVRKAMANVYFDTAASPFLYQPGIYRQVGQLIGMDKILFGTDYPLLPPSRYLREMEAAGLADTEREAILAGNALRLLGRA